MGSIATHDNQLKLIYNSKNAIGKQTQGYLQDADRPLLTIDTATDNMTGKQWSEIAEGLGIGIESLIDQENPGFQERYGTKDLDLGANDWLRILEEHPEFVQKPILLHGDDYHLIDTPSEVVQLTKATHTHNREGDQ